MVLLIPWQNLRPMEASATRDGGDTADRDVLIEVQDDRIVAVTTGVAAAAAHHLRGLTLPGFADAHTHAFHRALRGHTHGGAGSFWTWREEMYALAAPLDPDSYHRLARAVFGEMVLAGITCVGDVHYRHHQPDGGACADPNEMSAVLVAAAADAGLRITLLDTCYLRGGPTIAVWTRCSAGSATASTSSRSSGRGPSPTDNFDTTRAGGRASHSRDVRD